MTKPVRVSNLSGTASEEADALVDTGVTYCQVPADMAERLQLTPSGSRRLRLTNGNVVEYGVANALVELVDQAEPVATSVIIGERGAAVLLGALALDALGLGIDSESRRLIEKVGDLLFETQWPTY